jgi:hypothetical protein
MNWGKLVSRWKRRLRFVPSQGWWNRGRKREGGLCYSRWMLVYRTVQVLDPWDSCISQSERKIFPTQDASAGNPSGLMLTSTQPSEAGPELDFLFLFLK